MARRDYDDPLYEAARKAARERDGGRCRFPGCHAGRGLQAHHVLRWADASSLRTDPANLVTLCKKHHKAVTGHEDAYAGLFLASTSPLAVEMVRARYADGETDG